MTTEQHDYFEHPHSHGKGCGHTAIAHEEHTDYIHGGHLHSVREGHVGECSIGVSAHNPDACTPEHACGGHEAGHVHGPACGHEAVPHGSHTDYLVEAHLHHPHGTHCDDHGAIELV
jgi:hypothetical protein